MYVLKAKELLESVRMKKGWMTDYNVRHNFSTPLRVDELMAEQPRVYHTVLALVRSSQDAMQVNNSWHYFGISYCKIISCFSKSRVTTKIY